MKFNYFSPSHVSINHWNVSNPAPFITLHGKGKIHTCLISCSWTMFLVDLLENPLEYRLNLSGWFSIFWNWTQKNIMDVPLIDLTSPPEYDFLLEANYTQKAEIQVLTRAVHLARDYRVMWTVIMDKLWGVDHNFGILLKIRRVPDHIWVVDTWTSVSQMLY